MKDEEKIHQLRLLTKRQRAYLRLFPRTKPLEEQRRVLRQASRRLAPYRDTDVQTANAHELLAHSTTQDRPSLQSWLRNLNKRRRSLKPKLKVDLARSQADLSHVQMGDADAVRKKTLKKGIARSVKKAKKALRVARQSDAEDDFHNLRKRLKDLQYQLELWRPKKHYANFLKHLQKSARKIGRVQDLALAEHEAPKAMRKDLGSERRRLKSKATKGVRRLLQNFP